MALPITFFVITWSDCENLLTWSQDNIVGAAFSDRFRQPDDLHQITAWRLMALRPCFTAGLPLSLQSFVLAKINYQHCPTLFNRWGAYLSILFFADFTDISSMHVMDCP